MRNNKGQFIDGEDGKSTRFRTGQPAWNKGRHELLSEKCIPTQFKEGNIPPKTLPEGTLRRRWHSRDKRYEIFINIDPLTGARRPNKLYARYVMEQYLGRYLTSNEIVLHINGNCEDNDLENLDLITRADLARINRAKSMPK